MTTWAHVRKRTASTGEVWHAVDEALYKRTGDIDILEEAHQQQQLSNWDYPVPLIVDIGQCEEGYYFVEQSVGDASLHDLAIRDAQQHDGRVSEEVFDHIVDISTRLLHAQAQHIVPSNVQQLEQWFIRAGFSDNVRTENPDLDTPRTRVLIERVLERLRDTPMCWSHLDYGLPNAFPGGVIDWQHQGLAPLGYDVFPALEIIPFKGGNKSYYFTAEQRQGYLSALDNIKVDRPPLSTYLADFLLVKCFFFLALMRPSMDSKPGKYQKWQYRRALFERGLQQYESTGVIRTDTFPTLATFIQQFSSTG